MVNQQIAGCVNFDRAPISCSGLILPLRESTRNSEVNNSVLIRDYDSIADYRIFKETEAQPR